MCVYVYKNDSTLYLIIEMLSKNIQQVQKAHKHTLANCFNNKIKKTNKQMKQLLKFPISFLFIIKILSSEKGIKFWFVFFFSYYNSSHSI